MTKEQRDILIANMDAAKIRGIEYPSYSDNFDDGVCLKIGSQVTHDVIYYDWYSEDGRTVQTRRIPA